MGGVLLLRPLDKVSRLLTTLQLKVLPRKSTRRRWSFPLPVVLLRVRSRVPCCSDTRRATSSNRTGSRLLPHVQLLVRVQRRSGWQCYPQGELPDCFQSDRIEKVSVFCFRQPTPQAPSAMPLTPSGDRRPASAALLPPAYAACTTSGRGMEPSPSPQNLHHISTPPITRSTR